MIEILILEDTRVAYQYKTLVEGENENWNVAVARNTDEAIEYAKKVSLHILIFDQRLADGELGTNAFKKIIQISPLVQGIMLSGMATADELWKAEEYGGSCLYLNKSDVLSLPNMIYEAISMYYLAPRSSHSVDKLVRNFRVFPYIFSPISLRLLSYSILEDRYIKDDEWREMIIARAGQKRTLEVSHSKKMEIEITCTTKNNAGYEGGIALDKLTSAVKCSVENELKIASHIVMEDFDKETIDIQIPPVPEDTSKKYMLETRCEVAPSYQRYRLHYALECSCCNNCTYLDYDLLVPNQTICKRQVNVYSDNSKQVIPL